jgi:hypothetical protein
MSTVSKSFIREILKVTESPDTISFRRPTQPALLPY